MNEVFSERKDLLSCMLARRGTGPRTLFQLPMSGLDGKGSLFSVLKVTDRLCYPNSWKKKDVISSERISIGCGERGWKKVKQEVFAPFDGLYGQQSGKFMQQQEMEASDALWSLVILSRESWKYQFEHTFRNGSIFVCLLF